jgi:hypothetical protein
MDAAGNRRFSAKSQRSRLADARHDEILIKDAAHLTHPGLSRFNRFSSRRLHSAC